ncbi:PAS-domain containing protein [Roseibium sp. Sym1]|uniref:PAS-domain containing protein n=1 Tax=Roseibium sp. Sym1 TaxID=3016006 RepID=UPI0022B30AFE|nr:PAS-domain containing protein [Roseibium sp. Sym1]
MGEETDAYEEILGALDLAAVLFDGDGCCVVSNSRFENIFLFGDPPPHPGESMDALFTRLVTCGRLARTAGTTAESIATSIVTAIRGFARDQEVTLSDGGILAASSNPTRSGGYLVTFRDTGRDRLGENHALQMLSDAFDGAEMGVILWDASLVVQRVNNAWSRMIETVKDGDSILERGIAVVARQNDADQDASDSMGTIERFIAQLHRRPTQSVLVTQEGRRLHVATFPTQSRGVLATAIDVTERHSAESRAREILEDAIEGLGEGVALYDRDLRLVMNNGAFREIVFGNLPLSTPGMTLEDEVDNVLKAGRILVPEDQTVESVRNWIHESVRSSARNVEMPLADGSVVEASNFETPLGSYLISMRDITARKEAERATREADDLVRTIVEASPTTFLVSRVKDGKVIYIPPASRDRFGHIETTMDFFLNPADREDYLSALLPTGHVQDYPVRFRRRDGSIMHGLTSARVVNYKGEQVIVSSTRDITEQLAMQAELERQKEAAHQNEKLSALGALLAGVAHELNNPLSVVVGYSMMLEEKIEDPVHSRQIHEVSVAAERCSRIVKTFLAMARQRPTEIAPVDVNEIVKVAVEVAGHGLRANGAEIKLDLASDLPPIPADADQLVQVFTNLIVNAEHALQKRGPEGRLLVRSRYRPAFNAVTVAFSDNGEGIARNLQTRIFEPFFTTKDVGAGTGVGLAFCHRTITAHGGRIGVRSQPGSGATFMISLPAVGGMDAGAREEKDIPREGAGSVLVVDDDPGVLAMISAMLRDAGYVVTMASQGAQALALCEKRAFDAILSDIRMPEMDGLAFHQALAERAPDQARRLAFLSGDTLSGSVAEALKHANRPCLDKPATPADLLALVAQLTEDRR